MKKDEDQDQGNQTVRDQLRARKRADDLLQNDETAWWKTWELYITSDKLIEQTLSFLGAPILKREIA